MERPSTSFSPSTSPPPPARFGWAQVFKTAFSFNFEAIHQAPEDEQRRIGVAATIMGALIGVVGLFVGELLQQVFGFSTRLFFVFVGCGAIMVGIGAYRVGLSYFPSLAGTSRWASVARMLYVLVVLSTLAAGVFYALMTTFEDARGTG